MASRSESAKQPQVRRSQARGRATRARLLEAAVELFTRRGYDGTSIGDVAERAGVGVGTVYHHFPDKRAILLALMDSWADRLAGQERSELDHERLLGDDVRASFEGFLRRSYERLRKQPSLYIVALSVAGRDPEVDERYRRIEAMGIDRLRAVVEYGQRRGLMRASVDAAAAAFWIQHTLDVAAIELLVRGVGDPDPESAISELADMICRYLLEPPQ